MSDSSVSFINLLGLHLGKPEVFDRLLANGADINEPSNCGLPLLHFAIQKYDEPDTIRFLLSRGAKIDATDDGGFEVSAIEVAKNCISHLVFHPDKYLYSNAIEVLRILENEVWKGVLQTEPFPFLPFEGTIMKTLVVGDLHGDLLALQNVLELYRRLAARRIIFLGDFIDRGNRSLEVLDELMALSSKVDSVIFLRGNHERYLLQAFKGELPNIDVASSQDYDKRGDGLGAVLRSPKRQQYIEFIKTTAPYFIENNLFCSHAPVYKEPPFDLIGSVEHFDGTIRSFEDAIRVDYDFVESHAYGFNQEDLLVEKDRLSFCGHLELAEAPGRYSNSFCLDTMDALGVAVLDGYRFDISWIERTKASATKGAIMNSARQPTLQEQLEYLSSVKDQMIAQVGETAYMNRIKELTRGFKKRYGHRE